jgi:hypothetical protein
MFYGKRAVLILQCMSMAMGMNIADGWLFWLRVADILQIVVCESKDGWYLADGCVCK